MAIRNIRYDGDDILRKVCRPVEKMDDRRKTTRTCWNWSYKMGYAWRTIRH